MTISRNDEWIQIAELNASDHICFTASFGEVMGILGWEAKAFVGHLLGLWADPFEHMLDYSSGEAQHTQDQPGDFDRNWLDEPQEVVEYSAEIWSTHSRNTERPDKAGTGMDLDIEWYRDVLRAKLVSLRLPKRLLLAYRDAAMRREGAVDADSMIPFCDEAVKRKPDDPVSYYRRGEAYREKGDFERATADYDKAIQLRSDYAEAYYSRGLVSRLRDDAKIAAGDFKMALELSENTCLRLWAQQELEKLEAH